MTGYTGAKKCNQTTQPTIKEEAARLTLIHGGIMGDDGKNDGPLTS